MGTVILGLATICGLVSLGCWIMTIVKAFQSGETMSGVLSICPLIGFILGWINASKWGHTQIMLVWTACVVVNIILNFVSAAIAVGNAGN